MILQKVNGQAKTWLQDMMDREDKQEVGHKISSLMDEKAKLEAKECSKTELKQQGVVVTNTIQIVERTA